MNRQTRCMTFPANFSPHVQSQTVQKHFRISLPHPVGPKNTTNREYSAREICWSFPLSSTTLRLETPMGGVEPPPLSDPRWRNTVSGRHIPELYYTSGTRPLQRQMPANQRRDSFCDVIAGSTTRGSPSNAI